MCLIALALDAHPRYSLVVAANRDEFHQRPAAPASYWDDAPKIFGGRDLQQHGSWFALTTDGRWSAVTNVRRMVPPDPRAPSRGALVAEFLRSDESPAAYAERLAPDAPRYAGFNLLLGDHRSVHYASNQHDHYRSEALNAGVHAVSNASLDTPWPKLVRLRDQLAQWCTHGDDDLEPLFASLQDRRQPADAELPDTGVGLEMERLLSSPFIVSERYGTRACTVLAVTRDGQVRFHERRYGPLAAPQGETVERLQLKV
ncbi:NRDE family protein [Sinimarinibacterium sp. CAU 1509]|uniref:NRDE family protein n=1 Tax=Sinimarinibacterium sp. CAU 1509 TaxID=2562283 RepID=UPI0010AD0146|nr:NRDE family protein [Sinimarinibacterium sp. CAU 1509]TJY59893.1 NRDE family protein [Sinimarinibacterium sp. CAU 1509]